ncbi:MAG: kinase [Pseudonocardiales bacterium]|nr:kinase [Pseudonocardiales bacterium]
MPDLSPVGSAATRLIILRGNSGAGKSTVARTVRDRYGRGCALVEQDYLRRGLLRERDIAGGVAPLLIAQNIRIALDHGYHVICEGILARARYGACLADLCSAHQGQTFVYYLDVSLEESLRRHAARPQATEFTEQDMRGWYAPRDLLEVDGECVIGEESTLESSVALILSHLLTRGQLPTLSSRMTAG